MNADQLKAYKRDKSKKFNAHLRDLRLKEKKRIADNQPDQQDNTIDKQDDQQPDDKQDDNLTIQDLMDIYETLDTKMDIIQNKLETIMENKLDLIDNKLETIMENKLETNQPIKQQPSIFFA